MVRVVTTQSLQAALAAYHHTPAQSTFENDSRRHAQGLLAGLTLMAFGGPTVTVTPDRLEHERRRGESIKALLEYHHRVDRLARSLGPGFELHCLSERLVRLDQTLEARSVNLAQLCKTALRERHRSKPGFQPRTDETGAGALEVQRAARALVASAKLRRVRGVVAQVAWSQLVPLCEMYGLTVQRSRSTPQNARSPQSPKSIPNPSERAFKTLRAEIEGWNPPLGGHLELLSCVARSYLALISLARSDSKHVGEVLATFRWQNDNRELQAALERAANDLSDAIRMRARERIPEQEHARRAKLTRAIKRAQAALHVLEENKREFEAWMNAPAESPWPITLRHAAELDVLVEGCLTRFARSTQGPIERRMVMRELEALLR